MNYTEEILYKSKRTGIYYKTKEEAEKSGLCKCGNVKPKNRIYCDKCKLVKKQESELKKFKNKPIKNWDNTVKMCYDENTESWFHDKIEVTDYYFNEKLNIADVRLVEGIPKYLSEIETDVYEEDIYGEDIADEFDFPHELIEALEKLNEIASKIIGCYVQGYYRIEL